MSGFFKQMGWGLDQNELYTRAFEKGVLLKRFPEAADIFDKAAKKFAETGNQMMATQASANSLLYRYLATGDANLIVPLLQTLQQLPQIEAIGSQTEMRQTGPLCAELDCRLVEAAIAQAKNDVVRSRDLHRVACEKFKGIMNNSLLTYGYQPAPEGNNEKANMRYFYHNGMGSFYEAMTKKDTDPSAASDDLAQANQSFKLCNDQRWNQTIGTLLDNWRISRTCWLCHRDMQGNELHFSMCHAEVTPYAKMILEKAKQDSTSISIERQQIAVCTPCGSMITFKALEKAREEADKVRQELNAKLEHAMNTIHALERRVNHLEGMSHRHS